MKLRNKKTGEIDDVSIIHFANKIKGVVEHKDGVLCLFAYTLKEFNEEWEDYTEDPKRGWFINSIGGVYDNYGLDEDMQEEQRSIGNYFETEEEAEKAVEKLRAWKRLKDKGGEFYGWRRKQTGTYELYLRWEDRIPRSYEVKNDLDLLFGGVE